jgi:hypothetical protein
MALDAPHIGFVVRETPDKIVVFGETNERYDYHFASVVNETNCRFPTHCFFQIYSIGRLSYLPYRLISIDNTMGEMPS